MFGVAFFGTNYFGETSLLPASLTIIPQVPGADTYSLNALQQGKIETLWDSPTGSIDTKYPNLTSGKAKTVWHRPTDGESISATGIPTDGKITD